MIDALKVIGPFRGTSGYDQHTREFVRHLLGLGVRVQLENHPRWSIDLPAAQRERLFDLLDAPVQCDTVLHFTMPNRASIDRKRRNINYTMFEADGIPAAWARCARDHARIVVPTESSRRAWIRGGVPESQLRLCPLGVDGEFFAQPASPLPLKTPDGRALTDVRHRFLNIAELRPRKNHLGLLRAWIRATRADDDAVLILKLSTFQPGLLQTFQQDLQRMQQLLGRSLRDAAPVCIVNNLLSRDELRSLFACATHYISLSKGEGWDLVMMEAAASGLRLIAPHHSAYCEYLQEDDAELIPSALVPVAFEGKLGSEDLKFFRGLSWWQPDEHAAVEVLQGVISGRRPLKPSPRARITAQYSWQRATRRLLDVLDE